MQHKRTQIQKLIRNIYALFKIGESKSHKPNYGRKEIIPHLTSTHLNITLSETAKLSKM